MSSFGDILANCAQQMAERNAAGMEEYRRMVKSIEKAAANDQEIRFGHTTDMRAMVTTPDGTWVYEC